MYRLYLQNKKPSLIELMMVVLMKFSFAVIAQTVKIYCIDLFNYKWCLDVNRSGRRCMKTGFYAMLSVRQICGK